MNYRLGLLYVRAREFSANMDFDISSREVGNAVSRVCSCDSILLNLRCFTLTRNVEPEDVLSVDYNF